MNETLKTLEFLDKQKLSLNTDVAPITEIHSIEHKYLQLKRLEELRHMYVQELENLKTQYK